MQIGGEWMVQGAGVYIRHDRYEVYDSGMEGWEAELG